MLSGSGPLQQAETVQSHKQEFHLGYIVMICCLNRPLLRVDTVLSHKQVLCVIHTDDMVRLGPGWVPHSLTYNACC